MLARLRGEGRPRASSTAPSADRGFGHALLDAIGAAARPARAARATLVGVPGAGLPAPARRRTPLEPAPLGAEQSNTLDPLRRPAHPEALPPGGRGAEPGPRDRPLPDREGGLRARRRRWPARSSTARARASRRRSPSSRSSCRTRATPGASRSTRWTATSSASSPCPPRSGRRRRSRRGRSWTLARREIPAEAQEPIGTYLSVGPAARPAHRASCTSRSPRRADDPAFAPEPFTPFYQRSLYQSMRNLTAHDLRAARSAGSGAVPEDVRERGARRSPRGRREVLTRFRAILDRKITALRTRVHGDYHLGQVLRTGNDFVIIDFEGEPALPAVARAGSSAPRCATWPACSARSTTPRTTGCAAWSRAAPSGPRSGPHLEPWADHWYVWVSARVPARLPRGRRERPPSCRATERELRGAAHRLPAREGGLRARLRAQQPAGLGPPAAWPASVSCWTSA